MIKLMKEIDDWQLKTFGNATVERLWWRFLEEYVEFRDATKGEVFPEEEKEEIVDCFIVFTGIVAQVFNGDFEDFETAVKDKMKINKNRKWKVDGEGCGYHE